MIVKDNLRTAALRGLEMFVQSPRPSRSVPTGPLRGAEGWAELNIIVNVPIDKIRIVIQANSKRHNLRSCDRPGTSLGHRANDVCFWAIC